MTITIDTVLGIVGLLVTIFLGYLGLKYTLKFRKKTEIIFLKNTSISLFKTIVKNLDDIEINYQGKKINENLILFKGTFFNNGNIDIEKSIIHKPLEIELPTNYKWVMHKLIDHSEGLEIESSLIDNKLVFKWDLLKEGEYFTFDSLVEYKSDKDDKDNSDAGKKLLKRVKINHRITDLKNISKENSIPRPISLGGLTFILLILLGVILGISYLSFGQLFFPKYEVLTEVKIPTGKEFVTLSANNESSITLLDKNGDKVVTYSKTELAQKLGADIQIKKTKINYLTLCFFGLLTIVYFIFWITLLISQIRERSLYKKLKTVAEKYTDLEDRGEIGLKSFELLLK